MPLTSKHQQWLSLKWLKKSKQAPRRYPQQKAYHQTETGKQKDAGKDEGVENTSTRLEKPDLEAMIGQLLQKNGDLVKAASTAIEETIKVRARVRGQQNRVAELEGQ